MYKELSVVSYQSCPTLGLVGGVSDDVITASPPAGPVGPVAPSAPSAPAAPVGP